MTRFPLPLFLGIFGLAACNPIDVGDDDTDEPAMGDEWSDYVLAAGFTVSFSDLGFSDDVYLAPAYMVGYGGDLGYSLDSQFRSSNSDGRFAFEAASWDRDCYLTSLISSLEALDDGSYSNASSWDETADWWDNHQFCTSGSPSADQWCAHESGYNYFVSFCVTSSGVVPNGDGI